MGRMDLDGSGDLHVLVRWCMLVVLDIFVVAALVSSVAIGTCKGALTLGHLAVAVGRFHT